MRELPVSQYGHRYGLLAGARRHTAYGISSVPGLKFSELPPAFDLARWMPAVKNQLTLGGCTAFTASADRESLALQFEGKSPTLSPLFLYYVSRKIDGSLADGDCGSTGETTCVALQEYGVCLESSDPFDPNLFQVMPSPAQALEAITWRAGAYHSLFNVQDLKTCIFSGYRVRVGINVYDSFENDIKSDGLMRLPDPDREQLLGGHEVLAYGFDDSVKCPAAFDVGAFLVRNSWGAGWGRNGDFWMPYEAVVDPAIALDAKIQHLGGPWIPAKATA